MAEESFELEVVDVVEETDDARSISFGVPAGAEEQFRYRPEEPGEGHGTPAVGAYSSRHSS